jgi:hypothetical protein
LTQEIVAYRRPTSLDISGLNAVELAERVANTDFVPKGLRGNPPAILCAILYGHEIGLTPMQSLAKIAVIDGRPALSAEGMRGLILAAGHDFWIEDQTNTRVTVAGRRADGTQTSKVTWTLDDAKRARIAGKANWQAYPRQMLFARATAELARAIFADVIGGLSVAEELDGDGAGEVVTPEPNAAAEQDKSTRRRRRIATPEAQPPPPPEPEPVPEPTPPPEPDAPAEPMSIAQRGMLFALFAERGIDGRDERLAFANAAIGRTIESSNDLSSLEASRVIDALKAGAPDPRENEQEVIEALETELDATESDAESPFPEGF